MCGIIGCMIRNPEFVKSDLNSIYDSQKHRGQNGFGYALENSSIFKRYRTTTFSDIYEKIEEENFEEGDIFLFHHRMPTSTRNIEHCNHPITSEEKDLMIIHNGIITDSISNFPGHHFETKDYNYDDNSYGIKYYGYYELNKKENFKVTDSEFIVHSIQNFLDEGKDFNESLKNVTEKYLFSSFLLIRKNDDKIYFGSNNQDLLCFSLHNNLWLSSECPLNINSIDLANAYGYIDKNGKIYEWDIEADNNFLQYQNGYSLDYERYGNEKKEKEWNEKSDKNQATEIWKKYKYDLW
jgi:hypothetical protein